MTTETIVKLFGSHVLTNVNAPRGTNVDIAREER